MATETTNKRRHDYISALPEMLALQLLVDQASGRPLLDPASLAHLEAAGGGIGRLARTCTQQWIAILDDHRWLLGRASVVPTQLNLGPSASVARATPSTADSMMAAAEAPSSTTTTQVPLPGAYDWSPCLKRDARALKMRALKLAQWARGSERACGHVLLVGGNVDRSLTFAEEPVNDASVVRDCRLAHRRFESASYARGEVDEGMSRPLHQSSKPLIRTLCGLRVARSSCAAVRRPHDGAIVCFGGWNGRSSLRSVEHLDCSSEVISEWRWRRGMPDMKVARCYLAGACREDGSIWALGGGSSLWQHAATYKSTEFLLPYDDDDGSNNTATGSSSNAPIEGDGNEMWETDDDDDDDDDDSDDGSNLHGGRGSGGGMRPPSPSPPPPPTCAQQWRPGPDMLVARCGHGAAVAHERGGALYAVGGYGGGLTYHSSAEVLAGDSEARWAPLPAMKVPRTGCGVAMGPDGCVYAVGGSPDGSGSHATAERLDPRDRRGWQNLPQMCFGRSYCSAAFGLSGLLVASGGMDRNGEELQSLETLDVRMLTSHTTSSSRSAAASSQGNGEGLATGQSRMWQVVASSASVNLPRADHASVFVEFPDQACI